MPAHLGVERRERLVEQQQARRSRQRTGQCDALLLPAGQLRGVLGSLVRQANQFQQFLDAGGDFRLVEFLILEAEGDVFPRSQVREQCVGLEHDAEVALRGGQRGDIGTILEYLARGLDVEPGDGAQKSGLAAARRAEETNELALVHFQRNVVKRGKRPELLGQSVYPQVNPGGRGFNRRRFVHGL